MNQYIKRLLLVKLIISPFVFYSCATKELILPVHQNIVRRAGFQRDVIFLIKALKYKDKTARKDAIKFLGEIKDIRAVEPLISILKAKETDIRIETIKALGKIKDPRSVEHLIAILKIDTNKNVRIECIVALGEIRDFRAIESLVISLVDKESDIRIKSIIALNKIDPNWPRSAAAQRVVPFLITALNNQDLNIRKIAIKVLGKIRDTRAIESLIILLIDKNSDVRIEAKKALKKINHNWLTSDITKSKVTNFIDALDHSDLDIQRNAIWILGEIKDSRAVEPLISILRNRYSTVKEEVVKALVKIGEPSISPLIEVIRSDGIIHAALALASFGSLAKEAIPILIDKFPIKTDSKKFSINARFDYHEAELIVEGKSIKVGESTPMYIFMKKILHGVPPTKLDVLYALDWLKPNLEEFVIKDILEVVEGDNNIKENIMIWEDEINKGSFSCFTLYDGEGRIRLAGIDELFNYKLRYSIYAGAYALTKISNKNFVNNQDQWREWWEKNNFFMIQEQSIENLAWKNAKSLNTIASYSEYLDKYPTGLFSKEAYIIVIQTS